MLERYRSTVNDSRPTGDESGRPRDGETMTDVAGRSSISEHEGLETALSKPCPIEAVDLKVLRVPYKKPFGISSGTSDDIESIVVTLRTSEGVGYGESVAMMAYTGQTLEGLADLLTNVLIPAVKGIDARDVVALHSAMNTAVRGQRVAKAAIDIAAHDFIGRVAGVPTCVFLGSTPKTVRSAFVAGLGDLEQIVEECQKAVARGYRHIKVKGGVDWRRDVLLVEMLRENIDSHTELCIDLNEGYDRASAMDALPRMRSAGLDLIEQPLPAWDLAGIAELRSRVNVPIMLDESVQSVHQGFAALAARAADVINIKILKLGGLYPARQVIAMAQAAGVPVKLGSMPELGIASRAAVHLACASPNATVPGDYVGPVMVENDPFAGEMFPDDGTVIAADQPGLGDW